MYPPNVGAITLPTYVAVEKREIRSPRLVGNISATEASATGTNIPVANPW